MERLAINGGAPVSEKKIPLTVPYFDENDINEVTDSLRTAWVAGNGKKSRLFEKEFSNYLGVKHAFLTTSCTAALDLAFMALELKDGEVIVPDFTYTSTAVIPLRNGLDVRFCDVEYDTANIDAAKIERCITPRTRAIVPIDYAGVPCKIDEILKLAEKYNLKVVLDAAQSCGSKYKGRPVGGHAPISCFSFQATKNFVTGEGGCLVTNDDGLAEKIYIMRDIGEKRIAGADPNWGYQELHEFMSVGNSYIQSDILGALALSQLRKLDWMTARRKEYAEYLNNGLRGIPNLQIPAGADEAESNWSLYTVRVPEDKINFIRLAMNAEGIACDTHYRPLHSYPLYRNLLHHTDHDFPVAVKVAKTLLRLPMHVGLTKDDLDKIIYAAKKVFSQI